MVIGRQRPNFFWALFGGLLALICSCSTVSAAQGNDLLCDDNEKDDCKVNENEALAEVDEALFNLRGVLSDIASNPTRVVQHSRTQYTVPTTCDGFGGSIQGTFQDVMDRILFKLIDSIASIIGATSEERLAVLTNIFAQMRSRCAY
ncbi:hypothetical protein SK128_011336 [Halocaridina rubra]|uniref:Uncharacterized protein n=1 Tax=Halocaridina rubra TaxID=373956 RepID=A0AAN8WWS3_HALRR